MRGLRGFAVLFFSQGLDAALVDGSSVVGDSALWIALAHAGGHAIARGGDWHAVPRVVLVGPDALRPR